MVCRTAHKTGHNGGGYSKNRRHGRSLRRRRGFTVLELIVVFGITGTLMGVLLSMMGSLFFGDNSAKENNQLVQALTFCQNKAVLGQQVVYLEFNLVERWYRAFTVPPPGLADPEDGEGEGEEESEDGGRISVTDLEKQRQKEAEEKRDNEARGIEVNRFKNVDIVLGKHEYAEAYGIVKILDPFGGVYQELPSYVIAFHPNGFSQSTLFHMGSTEQIDRTIYINRYTGKIKNVEGEISTITDVLKEEDKEESEEEYSEE